MKIIKSEILNNVCYTELAYERINKKLSMALSKKQIEEYIYNVLEETSEKQYTKTGKNFYIINNECGIKITINSNTFRVITADRI